MVIEIGKDRPVMVDAGVDTVALGRVGDVEKVCQG